MATMQAKKPDLDTYIEEGNDSGPAVNEQNVSMLVDGRQYGIRAPSEQLFEQPIPPIFRSIADEIWRQSAILGLDEEGVTKEKIFAAYRQDLKLLQKYLGDFEQMVRFAIQRSIMCLNENGLSHEKQWEMFQTELPLIGKDPLLKLSSDRAAKPATTLLLELKEEFEKGVVRVVTRMAFWIQMLVNNEFVGIMTWNGPDVCNYHYFLHEKNEKVVGREENTTHERNGSNVPGELMTATKTTRTAVQQQELRERHTHHLVNAKRLELSEFTQRVPSRVASFIESVPSWLIPHLQIVTGEMTMEEVRYTKVSDKTVVTETVSVWKYDPAVAFGRFALMGWTDEETDQNELGGTHYRFQTVAITAKRKNLTQAAIIATVVILMVGTLITLGVHWYMRSSAEALATYNAYTQVFEGERLYTTKKGEILTLPGTPRQLRYAGTVPMSQKHEIRVVQGDTIDQFRDSQARWFTLPTQAACPEENRTVYGDADLAEAGYLAKLRIVNASDDEITYAVSVYQK